MSEAPIPRQVLFSRTVIGIVLATFFSDVGHEMATAVLPLYLASIGLGPAALGMMEGVADLLFSLAKLSGGIVGHHIEKKKRAGALGYLATAMGTGLMAFAHTAVGLVSLRAVAWIGRGFRSPLRDFLLSDAVPQTHFGRVYGVERAADMLGAVGGPVIAAIMLAFGAPLHTVIVVSLAPSLLAAASFFFFTEEKPTNAGEAKRPSTAAGLRAIPRGFWVLLGGVLLFGLGDFSRTFLILLAAGGEGGTKTVGAGGAIGTAVILYSAHNAVSAIAAYPVGHYGDRFSKLKILAAGYALGVATNAVLAIVPLSFGVLCTAIALSGVTLAVEETLEKAAVAQMLTREVRTLGLGILAATNAVGDMLSSVFVGWQLEHGTRLVAFGVPTVFSLLGAAWVLVAAIVMKL